MATFGFSLTKKSATDTSLVIEVTTLPTGGEGVSLVVAAELNASVVSSTTVTTALEGQSVDATITGLSASTEYTITAKESGTAAATSITATTKAAGYDDPKTATQEQWENLADRIKAKADTSTVPTITMTTTDPGEGSALAANNYLAVYGGDPIIMDYSTTEVNTGAKWIDGSAIYKKTVNFGALPASSSKTVAHGITNLKYVVDWHGMTTYSGDSVFRPLPMVSPAGTDQNNVEFDATYIYIYTSTDRSNFSAYITLYYTKSS